MAQLLHEKDKQIQTLSEKKQTMVDAAFGLHDEVKELNATIDDLKLNRLILRSNIKERQVNIRDSFSSNKNL